MKHCEAKATKSLPAVRQTSAPNVSGSSRRPRLTRPDSTTTTSFTLSNGTRTTTLDTGESGVNRQISACDSLIIEYDESIHV